MKKIKIGYPVEGFSSKEEREAFRNKIMVIRGKTGKTVDIVTGKQIGRAHV